MGDLQVLGSLLGPLPHELLEADPAGLAVALELHNPSESSDLVAVEGDDLSDLRQGRRRPRCVLG